MFTTTMQHIGQISTVGDTHAFGLACHDIGEDQTNTVYLNLAASDLGRGGPGWGGALRPRHSPYPARANWMSSCKY
jgi:hypothetical protein